MKLFEIASNKDDEYLLNVSNWVKDNAEKNDPLIMKDYFIDDEGRICTSRGGLNLSYYEGDKLPYPLGMLCGPLHVTRSIIASVENFPEEVPAINAMSCANLHSLVGIDKYVKKMHNPIQYGGKLHGFINLSRTRIRRGGIGLLNIEGLKEIIYEEGFMGATPSAIAWKIINKYLGRPDDIYECQAELIDHGLEEFAEL